MPRITSPGVGLQRSLGGLARDPRGWVHTGIVTDVQTDSRWGYRLFLTLTDGRPVEARPGWFGADGGRGDFHRIAVGAEMVVLCPDGDANAAIAAIFPASSEQGPGEDWNGTREINQVPLYVREQGDDVEGVLRRELLDDLHTHVGDVKALAAALVTAATAAAAAAALPTVTLANVAAVALGAANALAGVLVKATALQASAAAMETTLASAKAGGPAPTCRPCSR